MSQANDINIEAYDESGEGFRTLESLEEATNYNEWVCSKMAPYMGNKNLELGAGQGTISAIMARKYNLILSEVAPECLEKLRSRFKDNESVDEILNDYLNYPKDESLDCVYSSNVLEHIEDDLSVIDESCKRLKEGGRFVAFVPAGMWLYSKYDKKIGHFRRYGKKDKTRILNYIEEKKIPLSLEKYESLNPIGALGWWVKMKLKGTTQLNPKDAMLFNNLLPYIKFLDMFSFMLWGQNILLVLKKGK